MKLVEIALDELKDAAFIPLLLVVLGLFTGWVVPVSISLAVVQFVLGTVNGVLDLKEENKLVEPVS